MTVMEWYCHRTVLLSHHKHILTKVTLTTVQRQRLHSLIDQR
jgi:hypothetical protein